ncbi:class I SAM-dependent methyltransferase [Neobacillus massiliamazoniensis]|uniref:Methyltransferase type 11 protein n=1 Tax=Neobacillus massiliamazoniensis TaxID=1499688 RepID=A0A0U1P381_9BACI|nr:class I SAM-dependent methyltransferase [Neobacillus massiliamazoniensis]CRK84765.1 methyltransferase type 11 protein [Neobacillus massiliamazoniensis]
MKKEQLIQKFNKQAAKYSKMSKKQGQNKWRKQIFQSVKGKTLEVAVGAGMNFSFYPKDIEYLGVDFSPKMIESAKESAKKYGVKANFIVSDVECLDFPDNSFDTIVSSGSFCVYKNPVHILNLFNKWCKEDGQILLLEHGLFSVPTLAWIQKKLDKLAVNTIGCHQNRDILEIVKQSNLIIKKHERGILGYLYLIWAKPQKLEQFN